MVKLIAELLVLIQLTQLSALITPSNKRPLGQLG